MSALDRIMQADLSQIEMRLAAFYGVYGMGPTGSSEWRPPEHGTLVIREDFGWIGKILDCRITKISFDLETPYGNGRVETEYKIRPISDAQGRNTKKSRWYKARLWRKATPLEVLAAQAE